MESSQMKAAVSKRRSYLWKDLEEQREIGSCSKTVTFFQTVQEFKQMLDVNFCPSVNQDN